MERHYGGCLCYGPPIENGYYYDSYIEGRCVVGQSFLGFSFFNYCRQVTPNDFDKLETLFKGIVKDKQPFVRLEISIENLKEMFKVSE